MRPERADLSPGRTDLRAERADLRELGGGQTNGRTNVSPPVFYRTSSPSGPLPKKECLISDQVIRCMQAFCYFTFTFGIQGVFSQQIDKKPM